MLFRFILADSNKNMVHVFFGGAEGLTLAQCWRPETVPCIENQRFIAYNSCGVGGIHTYINLRELPLQNSLLLILHVPFTSLTFMKQMLMCSAHMKSEM